LRPILASGVIEGLFVELDGAVLLVLSSLLLGVEGAVILEELLLELAACTVEDPEEKSSLLWHP
jgi:hypothetical protein